MKNAWLFVAAILVLSCGDDSGIGPDRIPPDRIPPAPPSSTPEQLIDNLHRAMRDRDGDLYPGLLDEDFWFSEYDCAGGLVFANGREEELAIVGGSGDEESPGIFDIFRTTFEFTFNASSSSTELGVDHPGSGADGPDSHPDEDWRVFRGSVQMLMIDPNGDGYRVDQTMTYKLRQTEAGGQAVWRIIRWEGDLLAGDCGIGKAAPQASSWGQVKAAMVRCCSSRSSG